MKKQRNCQNHGSKLKYFVLDIDRTKHEICGDCFVDAKGSIQRYEKLDEFEEKTRQYCISEKNQMVKTKNTCI